MDLFKFPFHVDVWGTASEWIMIAVTSITAYFLYKTLQSQKDVQKAQNKLLGIEQLRLREDFKPNLKYNRFLEQINIDKPERELICIAIRNVSVNPALNVKPIYSDDEVVSPIVFKPNPHTLTQDGKYISLYFLVESKSGKSLDCIIRFTIEYEDVAGTKYSQVVHFDMFAGIEEFRTFDPKIIDDKT